MKPKIQNAKPLILSVILISLTVLLTRRRMDALDIWENSLFNVDLLFILFYLMWIIIESRVSVKEKDKGGKMSDRGSLELYAVSQGLTFLSAIWFGSLWVSPGFVHILGMAVFIMGVCIRLWAVFTLGRYYSHMVREVDGHRIIENGSYRYIRHPAYAGMITIHAGVLIFFFNPVTAAIFFGAFLPAVIYRIFVEERTLFGIQGYPEYARNRKRLIPMIW